jgi:hypothetical protein
MARQFNLNSKCPHFCAFETFDAAKRRWAVMSGGRADWSRVALKLFVTVG